MKIPVSVRSSQNNQKSKNPNAAGSGFGRPDEIAISFVLDMSGKIDAGIQLTVAEKEQMGSYIEFLNSEGYEHTLGVIYEVLSKSEVLSVEIAPLLDLDKTKKIEEAMAKGFNSKEKLSRIIDLAQTGVILSDDFGRYFEYKTGAKSCRGQLADGISKKLFSIIKADVNEKSSRFSLEKMIETMV